MCGLAGFAGLKIDASQRLTLVKALGLGIDSRGGHAAGFVTYQTNPKQVRYGRVLGKWEKASKGFALSASMGETTILHARYATHGSKELVDNAHPFAIARDGKVKLWGVHNGVISTADESAKAHNREFSVDSRELFELMADGEWDKIRNLQGYGTLAWIDKAQPHRILLVALTDSASLEIAYVKGGGAIFASTWHILTTAAQKAGLELEFQIKEGEEKVEPRIKVETGKVYALDLTETDPTRAVLYHRIGEERHPEITVKSWSKSRNWGHDYSGYSDSHDGWWEAYKAREAAAGRVYGQWRCETHHTSGYRFGCWKCKDAESTSTAITTTRDRGHWYCSKHSAEGYGSGCHMCKGSFASSDPFAVDANGDTLRARNQEAAGFPSRPSRKARKAAKKRVDATPEAIEAINTAGKWRQLPGSDGWVKDIAPGVTLETSSPPESDFQKGKCEYCTAETYHPKGRLSFFCRKCSRMNWTESAEIPIDDEFPCKSCAGNNVELENGEWVCRDCGFAWDESDWAMAERESKQTTVLCTKCNTYRAARPGFWQFCEVCNITWHTADAEEAAMADTPEFPEGSEGWSEEQWETWIKEHFPDEDTQPAGGIAQEGE